MAVVRYVELVDAARGFADVFIQKNEGNLRRMDATGTRNLVVVRCGDNSLHEKWLARDQLDLPLEWDLAVSYYGSEEDRQFEGARFVHRYAGGKWDGLKDFFREHEDTLDYDFIWLPDDDLECGPRDVNELFRLCSSYKFELAQPSLTRDSYASHLSTLWNPFFVYRNTALVEIMAPVLAGHFLRSVLPLLDNTQSGFGVDFFWHRLTSDSRTRVAVIDAVPVRHTRPVGSSLKKALAAVGTDGWEEARQLADKVGVLMQDDHVVGGKLRTGPTLRNRRLAVLVAAVGLAITPRGRHGFDARLPAHKFLVWVARNTWSGVRGTQ